MKFGNSFTDTFRKKCT